MTNINTLAFQSITSLTAIAIGSGVTSIGDSAFEGCTSLNKVYTHNDNPMGWAEDSNNVFYGSNNDFYGSNIVNIVFINDVLIKTDDGFLNESLNDNGNLSITDKSIIKEVILGKDVTSIGNNAFDGCSGLTSINIPNSVTSIGDYTFYDCTGLTSINIPNSVTSISENAFEGTGLKLLTIDMPNINTPAFQSITSLTEIAIGSGVTSIEANTFEGCTALTSITIPNSVTSIGANAFQDTGLKLLTIDMTDINTCWWSKIYRKNIFSCREIEHN